MNQQSQITDADLQSLLAQNPMAAEQLRRIIAERVRDEALALEELSKLNGKEDEALLVSDGD